MKKLGFGVAAMAVAVFPARVGRYCPESVLAKIENGICKKIKGGRA